MAPSHIEARVERDPTFGTDIYSSVKADFGEFELTFYVATPMAAWQTMVFHGDKGFIEVHGPFNAGDYEHARIEFHNQRHDQATVFRFGGVRQYRLEVEAFARAAQGGDDPVFTLEDLCATSGSSTPYSGPASATAGSRCSRRFSGPGHALRGAMAVLIYAVDRRPAL